MREIAPIVKSVLENKALLIGTEEQKKLLRFLCSLFPRAPHMIEAANDSERMMAVVDKKTNTDEAEIRSCIKELAEIKGLVPKITFANMAETMFSQIQKKFNICLLHAESEEFILSDKYGVLWSSSSVAELEAFRTEKLAGEEIDNVYDHIDFIFCPIAPRICIVFVNKKICAEGKEIKLDLSVIQKLAYNSAERYLYAADKEVLEKLLPPKNDP